VSNSLRIGGAKLNGLHRQLDWLARDDVGKFPFLRAQPYGTAARLIESDVEALQPTELLLVQERVVIPATQAIRELVFSVFLGVSLPRLFGVLSRLNGVARCRVSMMGRFFLLPTVMMLGRFTVMAACMRVMFGGLSMMLGCFLRHAIILSIRAFSESLH
jgi:hypothetical protein